MNDNLRVLIVLIFLVAIVIIGWWLIMPQPTQNIFTTLQQNIDHKYRILLITLETRDLPVVEIHNRNLTEYANLAGYDYEFLNSYESPLNMPVYWQKLLLVQEKLNTTDYDYVVWLDSDVFIQKHEVLLETLINESPSSHIYIGKDYPPTSFSAYCAGVFMIKNSEIGRNFIDECIDTYINRKECKNEKGEYTLNGKWAGRCYEQGVMNELIKTKYSQYVYEIPNKYLINDGGSHPYTMIHHQYGNKDDSYKNFVTLNNELKIKPLPIIPRDTDMKFAVLLTMHVNDERLKMYQEVLNMWKTRTNFDIYVVNSSNMSLSYGSIKGVFQFDQKHGLQSNPSIPEVNSIFKIFEAHEELYSYDMVFKVTGKYYISELENMANYIPSDTDICLQYQTFTRGQNCEFFGIRPGLISELKSVNDKYHLECAIRDLSKKYKSTRMPLIKLNKGITRSDGSIVKYL
jgi:hypothetical protein